jgi:hypothetical protein
MVPDKDRIDLLRLNGYSGVSKQTISIARSPKKFALVMETQALRLQQVAFPNDPFYPETAKKERKPQDPTMRFHADPLLKDEILKAFAEDGYPDAQTGLTRVMQWWLEWRRTNEAGIQQAG